MNYTFSENGVVVEQLTDQGMHLEFGNRDLERSVVCLLGIVGTLGVVLFLQSAITDPGARRFAIVLALAVAVPCLIACFACYRSSAIRNARMPSKSNERLPHNHVGGVGAAVIFLLAGFVFVSAYAGQKLNGAIVIPEWMGIAVVVAFATVFAWVFLFSRVLELGGVRGVRRLMERAAAPLVPFGYFFSAIDSWLVFVVAPAVGATLRGDIVRYTVFFTHIVVGCIFAWHATAPLGLIGAMWAFIAVVSVARRWSWIETDRNRLIQDPDMKTNLLRIGLHDDLRDEAVSGLLLLVLILPIAMRQFQLFDFGYPVFQVETGAIDRLDAWVGFFGVELLKALPFLDWADIYSAEAETRIHTSAPLSMHVLLVARAIIDLVFIGAILQALAISVSLSKNRRDFLERRAGVDALDPRIEARELARLSFRKNGEWRFREEIQQYTHYSPSRLIRLKVKAKKGSRLQVAVAEIIRRSGLDITPPAELLPQVTASKRIDPAEVRAVLDEIDELRQYDLDYLAIARRQLNWKSGVEAERKRLVQMIVSKVDASPQRERELAEVLVGKDADSLANIRVLVVQSLARNAQANPQNLTPLSHAFHYDRAKVVRNTVAAQMRARKLRPVSENELTMLEIGRRVASV
tara:strand:+ start:266 stop:2167 length:1902 start_codon:yes stop_codon:yes gene_type:complete